MLALRSRRLLKDLPPVEGECDGNLDTQKVTCSTAVLGSNITQAKQSICSLLSSQMSSGNVNGEQAEVGRRNRGRKPKPKCEDFAKCDFAHGKVLERSVRGRGRPKNTDKNKLLVLVPVLPHGAPSHITGVDSGSLGQTQCKKRGRKPKFVIKAENEINCVAEGVELADRRKAVISQESLHFDVENAGVSVAPVSVVSCGKGQSRKRGRKAKQSVHVEITDKNVETGCVSDWENQHVKEEDVSTIDVGVHRVIKSSAQKEKTMPTANKAYDAANQLSESKASEDGETKTEEMKAPVSSCSKMKLRSSRKVCNEPGGMVAEQVNQGSELKSVQSSACASVLADSVSCMEKESMQLPSPASEEVTTNTCSASVNLPQKVKVPVVKLLKCRKLANCSDLIQTSLTDLQYVRDSCIAERKSDSISAKENENHIENLSAKGKERKSHKILKVKLDFCKKVKKISKSSRRVGVSNIQSLDCTDEEQKLKGPDETVCLQNTNMSSSCIDHLESLLADLNNNKKESTEQNLVNECQQNQTGNLIKDIGSLQHDQSCPKSPQNTLNGEMSNNESLDLSCSSPKVPLKEPEITCCAPTTQTVEDLVGNECIESSESDLFFCQRVIPFSGKHIWKCSCARTSIWSFSRKMPSNVESTDILGLDSERSLEIYCQDVKKLFDNHAPTNCIEVEDIKVVCKKRRLESNLEETQSRESNTSKYVKSYNLKSKNYEMVSNVLSCREEMAISPTISTVDKTVCSTEHKNQQKPDKPCLENGPDVASDQTHCNQPLSCVQNGKVEEIASYMVTERKTSRLKTRSHTPPSKRLPCSKSENVELTSPRRTKPSKCKKETGDLEPHSCTDLKNSRLTPDKLKNCQDDHHSESHPLELHQIIKVFKSPNFKIPLRKAKEDRKCKGLRMMDVKATYSEEHRSNLQMMEVMQKNLQAECSTSSVSLSPSCRPEYPCELPNVNSGMLHRPSKDRNSYASASRDELFSSDYEELTKVKIHSSSNEYSELDLPNTLTDTWVKLETHPQCKEMIKPKIPDVLKDYEDDILVIDVIQDDPDLFDCTSGERCTSSEQASPLSGGNSAHVSQSSLVLKEEQSPRASKSCIGRLDSQSGTCNDYFMKQIVGGINAYQNKCNTLIKESKEEIHSGWWAESEERQDQSNFESPRHRTKEEYPDECTSRLLKSEDSSYFSQHRFQPPALPVQMESQFDDRKPPCTYDCRPSANPIPAPDMMHADQYEKLKLDHNPTFQQQFLEQTVLPPGYCKFFFNTFRGCFRNPCLYYHIPQEYDEKLCIDLLTNLVKANHIFPLRRAVWVFCRYYQLYAPGVHYDSEMLTKLISPLIQWRLWQDVFDFLETCIASKILPSVDIVITLFEKLASAGYPAVVPTLMGIFHKLVECGMILLPLQIYQVITSMENLQASKHDIGVILESASRFPSPFPNHVLLCDVMAEIGRCKEARDWIKLATFYLNVCRGCDSLSNLMKVLGCTVEALKDFKDDHSDTPYCVFADTVYKDPLSEEVDQNALGRIGISIMYHYHRIALWTKGKRVLLKLRDLNIQFTLMKGAMGPESQVSRCHVVNTATEILLKCGHLTDAVWVLKASEWTINTAASPCDRIDVLTRHNVLCAIAQETLSKKMFSQCFEVLQHLPGLHDLQSALSLGCFPTLKGNPYHNVLQLPCCLSDIEMLLSMEMFMVSNAVSIQSPGGSKQILQIVLKRTEDETMPHTDTYRLATDRLFKATRLSAPKLFIRHMKVNNLNEQVYVLEHMQCLKWLNENKKWAGKAWLFQ
uniref:Protein TOPAZ1 n=1 Tax=Leptobrachium leishanense TaxID=445787 RepID=A0A8C5QQ72_9ANUR